MKIYLFNPETGVYLGEDFADEATMKHGEYVLPPDATSIAPPPVGCGQLLIFSTDTNSWQIRQLHPNMTPQHVEQSSQFQSNVYGLDR